MRFRLVALILSTVLAAGCQSGPSNSAWLMDGDVPWVAADGTCVQLRPLKPADKHGFCYQVMTGSYQKKHHYETDTGDELAFLYPHVKPTPLEAQTAGPPPDIARLIDVVDLEIPPLPHMRQIYTALPFMFNKAHLTAKNRGALRATFRDWMDRGLKIVSVDVTGHTDPVGPENYNFLLSKWRAESVAYYLRRLGIPKGHIEFGGAGMLEPYPGAHTEAADRYVDLRVWLRPGGNDDEKMVMR